MARGCPSRTGDGAHGWRPSATAARFRAALTSIALLAALAGCGQGSSSGQDAKHSPTATTPQEASPGGTAREHSSPPPATARPKRVRGPRDLADITRVTVVHRPRTVLLRITLAGTTVLWPCAMPTGDYFEIYVDTGGDPRHERAIWVPWQCGSVKVAKRIDDGADPYCRVPQPSLDTSTSSFTLRVPVRCLGSPGRLRAYAFVLSDHMKRPSVIPTDQTAWTPFAAPRGTASVADPEGDTDRGADG